LPLFLAVFLHSQSLTDLAKKEKERRAAIKSKPQVITNVDLTKVKKKAAVEPGTPEKTAEQIAAEEAQAQQEGETPPATAGEQQQQQAGEQGQGQAAATAQKTAQEEPLAKEPPMSEKDFRAQLAECKTKIDAAQEQVDLYTLKMNGLWQEFYSLDDMKSRELIQLQISETSEKLAKAQLEVDKAKKALDDFQANARREGVPDIWIR
jgi:hypothetical protein